jgi:hypothetical protein
VVDVGDDGEVADVVSSFLWHRLRMVACDFSMSAKRPEDDDRLVEEIYDALDDASPERALASARIALHDAPDDPCCISWRASRSRARSPAEAVREFEPRHRLRPDDPEFRAARAQACSHLQFARRKDDARSLRRRSGPGRRALRPRSVLERRALRRGGREASRAARSIPERFQAPVRISRDAFGASSPEPAPMLPEEFRKCLDEVPVVVEDVLRAAS